MEAVIVEIHTMKKNRDEHMFTGHKLPHSEVCPLTERLFYPLFFLPCRRAQ